MYKKLFALAVVCCAAFACAPALARAEKPAATAANSPAVVHRTAAELQAKTTALAPRCVASTVGLVLREESKNKFGIGSGSGVVVSADGLVLTAGHVVQHPGAPVTIRFADGVVVQGVALGMDHESDTGMVRITDAAPAKGWPFSPLAPADSARPGEWVLAVGHPGSIVIDRDPPVRLGRVVAHEETHVETNCAIEPGDSGGPLFDLEGRVVGINSSIGSEAIGKSQATAWRSMHVPAALFSTQWKELLASKESHPEKRVSDEEDEHGTRAGAGGIGDAVKGIVGDDISGLLEKAGLLPGAGAPAAKGHAKKGAGVPADLRPFLRPSLKQSLQKEFPHAKVTDAVLDQILGKSSFDLVTGKIDMSPDLEDFKALGISEEELVQQLRDLELGNRTASQFKRTSLQTLAMFAPALDAAGDCVVEVCSSGQPILLGTIVDANGWIVTKASALGKELTVVLADGSSLEAQVVGQDAATDLALLKVEAEDFTPAKFASTPPLGALLASPARDPNHPAVGMVSVAARPIPKEFAHFYGKQRVILGIALAGNACVVSDVTAGMPADIAGLKVGDRILEFNGKKVSQSSEVVGKLKEAKSGDTVALKVSRQGKELTVKPVLGEAKSINETEESIGENDEVAGGKLSERRTNFPLAIQHDAAVWADECGGPLLNLQGETVGVNIARYDLVCAFAIPADVVQKTVTKLRAAAPAATAQR